MFVETEETRLSREQQRFGEIVEWGSVRDAEEKKSRIEALVTDTDEAPRYGAASGSTQLEDCRGGPYKMSIGFGTATSTPHLRRCPPKCGQSAISSVTSKTRQRIVPVIALPFSFFLFLLPLDFASFFFLSFSFFLFPLSHTTLFTKKNRSLFTSWSISLRGYRPLRMPLLLFLRSGPRLLSSM